MFRRRQVRTHGQLAREELGESLEHLRMAAAHAAGGAAGAIAPQFDKVRDSASDSWDSLLDAARSSARRTKKATRQGKAKLMKKEARMTRRRWPMVLGGLLAAGAVAGAAGAIVSRRRSQQKWNEYGTTRATTGMRGDARSALETGAQRATSIAESARETASDMLGTASDKLSRDKSAMSENTGPQPRGKDKQTSLGQFGEQTTATGSKNSRP